MAELNAEEVEKRVAILNRFKELLSQQRDRFRNYLDLLDKQKQDIIQDNAGDLLVHVELEENIVADIYTIQKVIEPLETMYHANFPATSKGDESGKSGILSGEAEELPDLRKALEDLRSEAITRSQRNRDLLSKRLEEIRLEIKALRANPYAMRRSLYSQEDAAFVDIKG